MSEQQKAKYKQLCDFVREQTEEHGGLGAVLLAFESHVEDELDIYINVMVDPSVKLQLIKVLRDMADRIEKEMLSEQFIDFASRSSDERSYTCPKCGATSYNAKDIEHGYCGACHAFQHAWTL